MIFIKRFIDKISTYEGKNTKDIVLPLTEARGLRDEVTKLLLELNDLKNKKISDDVIKININGGKFK